MVKLAVGSVAILAYSDSDRAAVRPRPVLVVAHGEHRDIIVCQITSRPYGSASAIEISDDDFAQGQLPHRGFVAYPRRRRIEVPAEGGSVSLMWEAEGKLLSDEFPDSSPPTWRQRLLGWAVIAAIVLLGWWRYA